MSTACSLARKRAGTATRKRSSSTRRETSRRAPARTSSSCATANSTRPVSESILDGITRDSVIRIAEDLGYTVHDNVSISRGELNTADELFFTGSAAEVTPIRKVDNVVIGNGSRGPVTEEIQQKFFEIVEEGSAEYDEWFEYVDV